MSFIRKAARRPVPRAVALLACLAMIASAVSVIDEKPVALTSPAAR